MRLGKAPACGELALLGIKVALCQSFSESDWWPIFWSASKVFFLLLNVGFDMVCLTVCLWEREREYKQIQRRINPQYLKNSDPRSSFSYIMTQRLRIHITLSPWRYSSFRSSLNWAFGPCAQRQHDGLLVIPPLWSRQNHLNNLRMNWPWLMTWWPLKSPHHKRLTFTSLCLHLLIIIGYILVLSVRRHWTFSWLYLCTFTCVILCD